MQTSSWWWQQKWQQIDVVAVTLRPLLLHAQPDGFYCQYSHGGSCSKFKSKVKSGF
jgi:hypothetical protein